MKNNLLKTIAVIAIAVAMLATTVTSFAATATTVTTYNETSGKPHVVSTISDVDNGVMVTYLASKEGTVSQNSDIVYIGQATSDGSPIVFSYDALNSNKAQILYGSNLTDVATALNGDANKAVSVAGVAVTGAPSDATVTVTDSERNVTETLGNTEAGSLAIALPAKYMLTKVTVDGVDQDVTAAAFAVKGGSTVAVEYALVAGEVELDSATSYFVQEISDKATGKVALNTVGLVCKINGTGTGYTYGVYAEKDNAAFELDATQETTGGFYPATVNGGDYYAVQLASEADLTGVTLYPYYNDGTENIICK